MTIFALRNWTIEIQATMDNLRLNLWSEVSNHLPRVARNHDGKCCGPELDSEQAGICNCCSWRVHFN